MLSGGRVCLARLLTTSRKFALRWSPPTVDIVTTTRFGQSDGRDNGFEAASPVTGAANGPAAFTPACRSAARAAGPNARRSATIRRKVIASPRRTGREQARRSAPHSTPAQTLRGRVTPRNETRRWTLEPTWLRNRFA